MFKYITTIHFLFLVFISTTIGLQTPFGNHEIKEVTRVTIKEDPFAVSHENMSRKDYVEEEFDSIAGSPIANCSPSPSIEERSFTHPTALIKRTNSIPLDVMIADDNKSDRAILKRLVETLGENVVAAVDDGSKLLDVIERQLCDFVFSDGMMPELGGPETVSILRKKGVDVPFYVVTSETSEEFLQFCISSGATGILHKPITRAAVDKVLELYRQPTLEPIPVNTAEAQNTLADLSGTKPK